MIKDNALLNSVVGDVFDFVESSNILVMKCYKYMFKDFSNSIGGMLSIASIAGSLVCSLIYFLVGRNQIKVYVYNIFENFMNFVEKIGFIGSSPPPKRSVKNENFGEKLILNKNKKDINFNEEQKEINNKNDGGNNFDNHYINEKRKIKIEKPKTDFYDPKSTYDELLNFRKNNGKFIKNKRDSEQITLATDNKKKNKKIKKKLDIFSAIR